MTYLFIFQILRLKSSAYFKKAYDLLPPNKNFLSEPVHLGRIGLDCDLRSCAGHFGCEGP